jgi:hypothetical protein
MGVVTGGGTGVGAEGGSAALQAKEDGGRTEFDPYSQCPSATPEAGRKAAAV